MKQDEILPLPDERNIIHNFVIQKHQTGLSPPEEKILLELEGREVVLRTCPVNIVGKFMESV